MRASCTHSRNSGLFFFLVEEHSSFVGPKLWQKAKYLTKRSLKEGWSEKGVSPAPSLPPPLLLGVPKLRETKLQHTQQDKSEHKGPDQDQKVSAGTQRWQLHEGKNCKRVSEVPKEQEVTPWKDLLPGVCPTRLGHLNTESSPQQAWFGWLGVIPQRERSQFDSRSGCAPEATDWCFSPSLSPSFPLSLKTNKQTNKPLKKILIPQLPLKSISLMEAVEVYQQFKSYENVTYGAAFQLHRWFFPVHLQALLHWQTEELLWGI